MSVKLPQEIQTVLDKTRDLQKQIQSVGQASIKELIQTFFNKHPEVAALRWTQYTPHFNDGEPCTFSVNEPEVAFEPGVLLRKKGEEGKWPEEDVISDGPDEFHDTWSFREQWPTVGETVDEIYTVFQEIGDTMLAIFGDGVEVTAARGAAELSVDEYDHD